MKTGGLQAKGKITLSMSTCLSMCKIAIDLDLPSVMVLRKGVFNLFIPLKLRSAVHVDMGYVNNVSINSQMELTVAMINSLWRHISVTLAFFPLHFCLHLLTSDLNLSLEISISLPK